MSVPQMPARSTSTTTSPGPGVGEGTSCTSARPGAVMTSARMSAGGDHVLTLRAQTLDAQLHHVTGLQPHLRVEAHPHSGRGADRKSTRLNSSHVAISYAVFCLKKKNPELYLS